MDEARATGNPVLEVHRRAAVAARHSQQVKLSRDLWKAGWSKSSPGEIPVEHPSNLLTTMDRDPAFPANRERTQNEVVDGGNECVVATHRTVRGKARSGTRRGACWSRTEQARQERKCTPSLAHRGAGSGDTRARPRRRRRAARRVAVLPRAPSGLRRASGLTPTLMLTLNLALTLAHAPQCCTLHLTTAAQARPRRAAAARLGPPASADEWYTREQAAAMMAHAGARLFASALPPRGDAAALRDGTVVAHMVKMLRVIVDGAAVEGTVLIVRDGHLHVLDGVHLMVGTSDQRSATGVTLPSATVSIPGAARGAGGAAKQLTVGVPVIVSAWLGGVSAVYERRERAAYRVSGGASGYPRHAQTSSTPRRARAVPRIFFAFAAPSPTDSFPAAVCPPAAERCRRDDLRVEPNDVSGRTSLYLKRATTAGAGAALLAPR
ncbi:hypothetical protein JKP88DRAFT_254220 [Tribonema minus]|uniref:Uncharacterized protein n=1 Tax=Tribonema minus TaxID=303371 RepID=A0A836CIT4_9STRA|nr:hypothetical protein JKP88DRAFT_254220 [Tribonema minus]